jgi:cell division transport system permease protein
MLDRIEFILAEAIQSLRRNRWMTFAAISTTAMALYLIGGLGYAYLRIQTYLNKEAQDFKLSVFLKDGLTAEDVKSAGEKIQVIDGVAKVTYVSSQEALTKMQEDMPGIELSDLFTAAENPLPNAYNVEVTDISKASGLAAEIKREPFVEEVQEASDLVRLLEELLGGLRLLGVLLGSIMLLTGGILIFNTIRLTIMARRREMRIMELVGATRGAIVQPLLLEGMIQGMSGGLLAGGLLWLSSLPTQTVVNQIGASEIWASIDLPRTLLILVLAGAVYGVVCSLLAVRERTQSPTGGSFA